MLIPLYGRKMAMDLYPDLFADTDCQRLFDRIDFEAPVLSGIKAKIGAVMAATRQYDIAAVCRDYLKDHPNAAVINLGCGLDTTFSQVDNATAVGYHVDFPDVIKAREALLPEKECQINIACDLTDHSWMDAINFNKEDGAVLSGYLCALPTQAVVLPCLELDSSPTIPPSATPFASHKSAVLPTGVETAFRSRSYR